MSCALFRRSLLPLLLLLLLVALPARPTAARPALASALAPELVAALDNMIETVRADAQAPGALLYVAVPGREAYSAARGLAEVATGTPLAPGARVRVASVTKSFVAVVTLQLVQEGWLLLDHSVEHWLPGLVPGGERITVRQLLNHTSGLGDYLTDDIVARARSAPEHRWTPEELVAEGLRLPRLFAPGAPGRWSYSNTNYILLGMIIERVTRHPLELELQQRVIAPLSLRGTALAPASADLGELAHGYVAGHDRTALNMSVAWAAGGISATVEDLAHFTQGLMWGSLLRPTTLNTMLDCTSTGGAWGVPDFTYGLGIMRRTLPAVGLPPAARLALGHTGSLEGYRTSMWYFPGSGITIVAVFTREDVDPNRLVSGALAALAAHGGFAPG
jgi:D-alanyl-D-alanine carboxypeptidase